MFAYSDHLGTCSAASGSAAKVAALREFLETPPKCRACSKANVTRIRIPKETTLVGWFPPLLRQVFHRHSGIPLSSNINFSKLQFDLQRETENNFVEL